MGDDDNFDDIDNNIPAMMIEMGDFEQMDNIDPLDVESVDLTLDQELSEDERSINQTHQQSR